MQWIKLGSPPKGQSDAPQFRVTERQAAWAVRHGLVRPARTAGDATLVAVRGVPRVLYLDLRARGPAMIIENAVTKAARERAARAEVQMAFGSLYEAAFRA